MDLYPFSLPLFLSSSPAPSPLLSQPKLHGFLGVQKARPRLHGFGVQKASKATQAARVWCAESEQSNPGCTGLVCRKRAKQPRLHGFGVQKASKATQAARVWCAESEQSNPGCTGLVCRKRAKQPRLHGFGVQKASKATQAARVLCAERNENKPTATRATVCGGSWLCRAVTPCH